MRVSPTAVIVMFLFLTAGSLALPLPSIAKASLESWMVDFQDVESSGLGSSPANCHFADQSRTLEFDPQAGVGDFVYAGGAKIPAKVKMSDQKNVEITFEIEPGEQVIMIGKLMSITATGSWTAATLSCGGTWTARRLD